MLSSTGSFADSFQLVASRVAFSIMIYRAALSKLMSMAATVGFQIGFAQAKSHSECDESMTCCGISSANPKLR